MFVRCALLWMDAGIPHVLLIHVTTISIQLSTTLYTFHMSPLEGLKIFGIQLSNSLRIELTSYPF